MADPLREALAALVKRWGDYGANASDLRRLLAAHPEPEPDARACPDCGRPDHPEHFCGVGRPPQHASSRDVQWPAGGALCPEPAEPPAPEGAVRVRIAVAVDADGEWAADGYSGGIYGAYHDGTAAEAARGRLLVGDGARLSWVEAWVPRPEAEQVVEGRVEPEGE